MKKLILIGLMFLLVGCTQKEITIKDFDLVRGCSPEHIDKILGQPQYEFVRGSFYKVERHFYWYVKGVWIYGGFWEGEDGRMSLQHFTIVEEPKLGVVERIATCGPTIIIKVKGNWLPFKKELPKEYTKQLTKKELEFVLEYLN